MIWFVYDKAPFRRLRVLASDADAHWECERRYRLARDAYGYEYAEIYWRERLACVSLLEVAIDAAKLVGVALLAYLACLFFLLC